MSLIVFLKEAREVAVVTLVGRLFHARAAVTRKEQSPLLVYNTIRYDTIRDGMFTCTQKRMNSQLNLAHGTKN